MSYSALRSFPTSVEIDDDIDDDIAEIAMGHWHMDEQGQDWLDPWLNPWPSPRPSLSRSAPYGYVHLKGIMI